MTPTEILLLSDAGSQPNSLRQIFGPLAMLARLDFSNKLNRTEVSSLSSSKALPRVSRRTDRR